MAMIRRADARTATKDALVLDLGDLVRQGDAIVQQGRRRAEELIEEAKRERDRIVDGGRAAGHAEGLAAGRAEGLALGREAGKAAALAEYTPKIEALIKSWSVVLEGFSGERETMLAQAREDVLALALTIAELVTRRAISADPGSVAQQLESVLSLISRPTRVRIGVHPDDEALAGELMPGLLKRFGNVRHTEVEADPAVERGSCILKTEGGASFDADLKTQLARIAHALVPERNSA